ncbi:hypothetical protein LBK6_12460 [Leptospira borgpetersenii serovar Hardjo]|nr:hypothetical protein LBK6_12460 [Leptospira borgpetersenii serovar Hardjo]AWV70864.1 hypothetical protein B9T54_13315 [Leptospira borgpetersenii serovar Hardjo-bovis]TQE52223.1 hypothetical protein FFZ95_11310 [Leptospira borgpetersenii]AMX62345.1 hypothetical protein LBK9_12375 [Leptospira borgpetersenii serovar Hardjo]AMX65587.1 hypothetical protein LBK30_12390 [Leptospira borgpetersenii serovar Hardjo]
MNFFTTLFISVGIKVFILSAKYVLKLKFHSIYGLYGVERLVLGRMKIVPKMNGRFYKDIEVLTKLYQI